MNKTAVFSSIGLLLWFFTGSANAVFCTNGNCDGSYNVIISNNNADIDAMFTIVDDALESWMWTDADAASWFGANTLPTSIGLHDDILTGTGLVMTFTGTLPNNAPIELNLLQSGVFTQSNIPTNICSASTAWQGGGISGGVCDYLVTEKTIPEPTTLALIGLGIAGLGFRRKTL